MILSIVATLVLSSWTAPSPTGEAWKLIRAAQRAVETATDGRFEREWSLAVLRAPTDRRALLATAALAQQRYQYERADSLYERIIRGEPAVSEYTAAARLGMGLWRAVGSDPARADSLLSQARSEALAARDWHIAFQALIALGKLRSRRAGPKAALELTREARSLADHPSPEESAQLLCTEGMFTEQVGDTTGRALVLEGMRIARKGHALRELGTCEVALAQIGERAGYFETTASSAADAVRLFEQIHFSLGLASASQWLGYARLTRGYYASARADLERAVRSAQLTRFTNVEAWARTDLADLYFALGDGESARQQAERAAALHSRYGDLWGLAVDLQFEGFVAEARGRLEDACARYAESVAAFGRAGLAFNATGSLRLLALAQMKAGTLDSAQRSLDEATRLGRATANVGWEAELPVHLARLAMLRGNSHVADSLIAVARTRYRWRTDSTTLLSLPFAILEAQLALRMHRVATADSAIAFIASAIEERRRGMSDRDMRAGLAQLRGDWGGLSDSYPELVAGLAAAGRLSSAFRFIESVRAREIAGATLRTIARMTDSSVALAKFQRMSSLDAPMSLEEARQRLRRDEALVQLTAGIGQAPTTAIVVTSDTAIALSLASRGAAAPLIDRYLQIAASGTEPVAVGRQLGAALLQPIARVLPPQITRLQISPDGELFRVPFDALRLADGRYAVERFAISIVPSATAGRMLHAMPAMSQAKRLVALGDPEFDRRASRLVHGSSGTARSADSARFNGIALARLPQSAAEANRVGQYGTTSVVWTRGDASETAVRTADWSTVGIVHFATHALIDGEGQARTALALAPGGVDDGFLTTSEIASLRFNGSLVVLSACQSLGGQILGGEGLRGLASPLFEAGARAIVVTHWSIGDRSVLPFVDRFYASMASGQTVGDALRQTKLAAIRDGARISDWAAFTVIGDASMRPPLRPRRLSPLDWLHDLIQPTRDTSDAIGGRGVGERAIGGRRQQ